MTSTEGRYSKFISVRVIENEPKTVIVDICGDVINDSPTEEELKGLNHYANRKADKNEYLFEFLRRFYKKEGRVPNQRDFINNRKYPSCTTYRNAFGSWSTAIRKAGLSDKVVIRRKRKFKDKKLLEYLIQFYEENGRPPTMDDFTNNPKYPGKTTYEKWFGSWQKALRTIALDTDSMVRKGIVETDNQKARLGEIFVLDSFGEIGYIDFSGINCTSPYDGKCPQGYNYDVKTSCLRNTRWHFHIDNVKIYEIEWFYMLAFNEDFTEILYTWRIPSENIEKGDVHVYVRGNKYNVENMKQYEVTNKIIPIFENWKNSIKKWSKIEILKNAKELATAYESL